MAESSRDAKSTKPESEKKQPETVLLTAEELRAIAGGGNAGGPAPVSAKDLVNNPGGVKKQ